MKKNIVKSFLISFILLLIFISFTAMLKIVDVQQSGLSATTLGLSTLNLKLYKFFGRNELVYTISDILGKLAFAFCGYFGSIGIYQWIKRKNIFKVDARIILLGCLYVTMLICYVIFDKFIIINYRPVMMDGQIEPSFPSSHTVLSLCILFSSIMNFKYYIKNNTICLIIKIICFVMGVMILVGRILAGVHWFSDIVGGILLSAFLIMTYYSCCQLA